MRSENAAFLRVPLPGGLAKLTLARHMGESVTSGPAGVREGEMDPCAGKVVDPPMAAVMREEPETG